MAEKAKTSYSVHSLLDSIILPSGAKVQNVAELKGATVAEKLATVVANFNSAISEGKHSINQLTRRVRTLENTEPPSDIEDKGEIAKLVLIMKDKNRKISEMSNTNDELVAEMSKITNAETYNTLFGKWFRL